MTDLRGLTHLSPDSGMLLALDIDGTLVAAGHQPSERAVAAVRALAQRGVMIVLATGRQLHGLAPVIAALGLEQTWVVASDGALLARFNGADATVCAVHMFEPRPLARALLDRDADVIVGCEDVGTGYLVNRRFETVIEPSDQQRVVTEFPGAVTMLTACSTRLSGDDLADVARAAGLSCTGWDEEGSGWVDVAARGLSKAVGVAQAARVAGRVPTTTVAVGDFFNDIDLLRWADVGVAMGQSPAEVRAAADLVTGSIAEDGLVDVLDALLAPVA